MKFKFSYVRHVKRAIAPILAVGLPTFVMNGIGSVMTFGLNQILQGFQETATGVLGVYFKLQSFFFMPLYGINNAAISILAFNYGAKNPKRIMKTLKIACTVAMIIMVTGFTVFELFPQLFIGMFNPSEHFMEMGCRALRIISIGFPIAADCVILTSIFQALGNGVDSAVISLSRQLLVLLPVAWLLSLSGNVNLVWWAFPISEIASALVSVTLFVRLYRRKIKPLYLDA